MGHRIELDALNWASKGYHTKALICMAWLGIITGGRFNLDMKALFLHSMDLMGATYLIYDNFS